jgi:hypothetical protein
VPLGRALRDSVGLLGLNALLLGTSFYVLRTETAAEAVRPLLALIVGSLGLGIAIVVAARAPTSARVGLLTLLLVAAVFVPLLRQHATTELVETILAQFRLGGVMVTVVPDDGTLRSEPTTDGRLYGRLVFLSSSHLYLEAECPRKLMIVPRRESVRLEFAAIRTAGLEEFRCEGPSPGKG